MPKAKCLTCKLLEEGINKFFAYIPKKFRPTKKHKNNKCLEKHSLQLLCNMFCYEINNNFFFLPHPYPLNFNQHKFD